MKGIIEAKLTVSFSVIMKIFFSFYLTKAEIIGLTWSDIDMKNKQVSINHQLIYRNLGEGSRLCVTSPKTEAGVRDIPMTASVRKAFEKQREYQFMMGIDRDFEVDGMKGFIFTSKNGCPLQPSAVNNVLYNIVDAYNKREAAKAKKEHRMPEMMPRISAHILRHTGCTRMAERGMDVKVLQYIMGHANIAVTMEVLQSYHRICENRKGNIKDGRPDGDISHKTLSDETRCRTVPQFFHKWGMNGV